MVCLIAGRCSGSFCNFLAEPACFRPEHAREELLIILARPADAAAGRNRAPARSSGPRSSRNSVRAWGRSTTRQIDALRYAGLFETCVSLLASLKHAYLCPARKHRDARSWLLALVYLAKINPPADRHGSHQRFRAGGTSGGSGGSCPRATERRRSRRIRERACCNLRLDTSLVYFGGLPGTRLHAPHDPHTTTPYAGACKHG